MAHSAALPCIVCGRRLEDVYKTSSNQPADGLAFSSHGHYGSTEFDPMDGSYLECSICDPCLVAAGERRQLLLGRDRRPVIALEYRREGGEGPCPREEADMCWRTLVGWQEIDEPLVPWQGDRYEENELIIAEDQIGTDTYGNIEWLP